MFFVCCIYYKKSNITVALSFLIIFSAVRGGFEPPVRLPARQFSKLLVSATHPSHQDSKRLKKLCCKGSTFF